MKHLLALLLILATPFGFADQALTRDSVSTLLEEVARAGNARDADAFFRHLDRSLKVRMEVPDAPEENVVMGLSEYRETIEATWAVAEQYDIKVDIHAIDIVKDGKQAIVKSTVSENLLIEGEHLNTESEEQLTIELQGDTPRIVELHAIIKL